MSASEEISIVLRVVGIAERRRFRARFRGTRIGREVEVVFPVKAGSY